MSQAGGLGRPISSKRRLKDLLLQRDNRVCADCSAPDPKFASANLGVFLCLKCCGIHRSLGTRISKVLSVALDEWSAADIDSMVEVGGNVAANSIYEAYLPEGVSKPKPNAGHDERSNFIRSKYEKQEFLKPGLRILSNSSDKSSLKETVCKSIFDNFRSSSQDSAGIVESIGMLKIKILKGFNLAVRDMLTSDPYVVVTLGQQKAQTAVMRSELNPIWNEELMVSVPRDYGPLKLQVFDYDTFSADDIMGEADIDIQPMISSATSFGNPAMFGNMQIGKWQKADGNALKTDSMVNIVDGKVKQAMSLNLQNVESGEIELELEWIRLDQ